MKIRCNAVELLDLKNALLMILHFALPIDLAQREYLLLLLWHLSIVPLAVKRIGGYQNFSLSKVALILSK